MVNTRMYCFNFEHMVFSYNLSLHSPMRAWLTVMNLSRKRASFNINTSFGSLVIIKVIAYHGNSSTWLEKHCGGSSVPYTHSVSHHIYDSHTLHDTVTLLATNSTHHISVCDTYSLIWHSYSDSVRIWHTRYISHTEMTFCGLCPFAMVPWPQRPVGFVPEVWHNNNVTPRVNAAWIAKLPLS